MSKLLIYFIMTKITIINPLIHVHINSSCSGRQTFPYSTAMTTTVNQSTFLAFSDSNDKALQYPDTYRSRLRDFTSIITSQCNFLFYTLPLSFQDIIRYNFDIINSKSCIFHY